MKSRCVLPNLPFTVLQSNSHLSLSLIDGGLSMATGLACCGRSDMQWRRRD